MPRKSPAFSFYPNDWFGGTMVMPAIERAAYIDLLALQWVNGGFSKNDAKLAIRGIDGEIIDRVIAAKFIEAKPNWFLNERLESEREKQQKRGDSARENGKRGGRPKTQRKPNDKPKGNPAEKLSDSDSVSDSINSLSHSTREDSKHWTNEEFQTIWFEWLQHQQQARGQIVTGPAEHHQLYELERFSTNEATEVVRFSLRKQAKHLICNGDHKREEATKATRRHPRDVDLSI